MTKRLYHTGLNFLTLKVATPLNYRGKYDRTLHIREYFDVN